VTDGERLRGVLVNLIANARESLAGAARPGAGEIELGARGLDRGGVALWVADRGPGIPPADLPHVFEPYFTTKRTGTGLGLAIARKVVEALGGTIKIESGPGEGTRVEVELPAEARTPTETEAT
jgi:two-component system sensor histidine kinase HydH